jgi:hypothetical protein
MAGLDRRAAESILVRSLSVGRNWKLPRSFWMLDLSHSLNLNRVSPSRLLKSLHECIYLLHYIITDGTDKSFALSMERKASIMETYSQAEQRATIMPK